MDILTYDTDSDTLTYYEIKTSLKSTKKAKKQVKRFEKYFSDLCNTEKYIVIGDGGES